MLKRTEMILIKPINAITSWESYEYQGHIALYIALKNIFDLLQKGMSISDYDLQIEGEEDFSIRKNDKYISIHQVKAGAVNLESNDKFSFIIGILQNKAEYGYFHVSKRKKIPSDFVSTTLAYIDMLQEKLGKKVILKKIFRLQIKKTIILFSIECRETIKRQMFIVL